MRAKLRDANWTYDVEVNLTLDQVIRPGRTIWEGTILLTPGLRLVSGMSYGITLDDGRLGTVAVKSVSPTEAEFAGEMDSP